MQAARVALQAHAAQCGADDRRMHRHDEPEPRLLVLANDDLLVIVIRHGDADAWFVACGNGHRDFTLYPVLRSTTRSRRDRFRLPPMVRYVSQSRAEGREQLGCRSRFASVPGPRERLPSGSRFRRAGDDGGSRRRRPAPRHLPRRQVRPRGGPDTPDGPPGPRPPPARPAPRRPPPRAHDRHDDLGLPGLAARRPRQGARPQPRARRGPPRATRARPERGARRHLRLGQPARRPAPRLQVRRRAGHVVRQGARARPRGRLAPPRQLRRRLAHRRRARRRGRRPRLQVLHDPERLRVAARQPPDAGLLPRQRAGGPRPRPARARLLARLRACGPASRSSRASPTPSAPPRWRPTASCP